MKHEPDVLKTDFFFRSEDYILTKKNNF
jgi:hypothetical protein